MGGGVCENHCKGAYKSENKQEYLKHVVQDYFIVKEVKSQVGLAMEDLWYSHSGIS